MLEGFEGVLVTDFYAAYDSLGWPQQKCLIHQMRDINQGLLAHPFDAERKSLAGEFGHLLREIVQTVDRWGLKQLHLRRHVGEAAAFLEGLDDRRYGS